MKASCTSSAGSKAVCLPRIIIGIILVFAVLIQYS